MSIVDEERLHPQLDRVLRKRLGFAPSPWPKPLLRVIERLCAERDLDPVALLHQLEVRPDAEGLGALIGAATIPHTTFFRHPSQLERFGDALGALGRPARVWSAGCASGEEPYSLALVARARGVPVRILATDVNELVLETARAGVYSAKAARRAGLGPIADDAWTVPHEIRAAVRFERASIAGGRPDCGEGPFDFVFCRNVLIYFDADEAQRIVTRLHRHVRPGGALILSPVEVLRPLPDGLARGEPLGWLEAEPPSARRPPPRRRAPTEPPRPPPPLPPREGIEGELVVAARAFGVGALDVAERTLHGFLSQTPDHAVAWFLLGEVLAQRGERTQAAIAFERCEKHAAGDAAGQTLARASLRRRLSTLDEPGRG